MRNRCCRPHIRENMEISVGDLKYFFGHRHSRLEKRDYETLRLPSQTGAKAAPKAKAKAGGKAKAPRQPS